MKKTIIIVLTLLAGLAASAQLQWERVNLGVGIAYAPNNVHYGPGLLKNHPERALNVHVSYRLWQHLEAGLALDLQGATAYGTSTQDDMRTVFYRNGTHWTASPFVQLHGLPFQARHWIFGDTFLRLGFTLGPDGFGGVWGGAGLIYNLTDHVGLRYTFDIGPALYKGYEEALLGAKSVSLSSVLGINVEL